MLKNPITMNRYIIPLVFLVVSIPFIQGDEYALNEPKAKLHTPETIVFDSLINQAGISHGAFRTALFEYNEYKNNKAFKNDSLLVVIDFSKPSVEKRFFIFDLKNKLLLKKTLVAHGQKSGELNAEYFSNRPQSHQSSLGLFVTKTTYEGRHGYSLQIDGLEKNLNDNAMKRAIVIHGASYVSENYIEKYGRIGRSFGCPALPNELTAEVIDLIKEGSCLYIYHPSIEAQLN